MCHITYSTGSNSCIWPPLQIRCQTGFPVVVSFFVYKSICQKSYFSLRLCMCIMRQLLAQGQSCSSFLQRSLGANILSSLFFLLCCSCCCFLCSRHTWARTVGYEDTTPMACKLTDGSGGITKLISACSNMITAKVRARLSECVSTLLSSYLLLCRSTPAIWPAAAPAAYASSWLSATAEAVGT